MPTPVPQLREFDGHCRQRQSLPASHRGPLRRARLPLLLCANTLVEASMERELLLSNNWVAPHSPAEPLRNPFGSLLPSQSDTLGECPQAQQPPGNGPIQGHPYHQELGLHGVSCMWARVSRLKCVVFVHVLRDVSMVCAPYLGTFG